MSEAPAIEAKDLCRRYGRRWALANVSFSVAPGEALFVAGHNGSGKTTLLRVLATALKPDRGELRVLGHSLPEERAALRPKVALLSHYAYTYESLSPLENLRITAQLLGKSDGDDALRAILSDVGLDKRARDPVSTFSAGMRKRLSLARILLQDPALILLDEPYGALDPPGMRFLDDSVARLRERGATLVLASHLLDVGARVCERGILLKGGQLVWEGPAAELPAQEMV